MKICSRCKAPIIDGACQICSRSKFICEANDDDEVYLTTAEFIFSRIIEDILNENTIPYAKKTLMGSGVTVYIGEFNESYKYYVKASDYQRALELIMCVFETDKD